MICLLHFSVPQWFQGGAFFTSRKYFLLVDRVQFPDWLHLVNRVLTQLLFVIWAVAMCFEFYFSTLLRFWGKTHHSRLVLGVWVYFTLTPNLVWRLGSMQHPSQGLPASCPILPPSCSPPAPPQVPASAEPGWCVPSLPVCCVIICGQRTPWTGPAPPALAQACLTAHLQQHWANTSDMR